MTSVAATIDVVIDRPSAEIALLTMNRPDDLNVLNKSLVTGLHDAIDSVSADPEVRVVILTGAGRGFCAGLDLNGYGDDERLTAKGHVLGTLERQREIAELTTHIATLRQPVIAAVNGPAAGGGLALACASDIRLCSPSAVFAVSFIRAGFSACDLGVSWLLPRIVGAGHAHELMLTGRRFDAEEAARIGLVTDVVDDVVDAAIHKASEIIGNAPASVELTKEGMRVALELPTLESAIHMENRQQIITAMTRDQREAQAAFLEKREPTYQNR